MEPRILAAADVTSNFIYLVSIVMFMLGIMRMGRVRTARTGNRLAAGSMLLACIGQAVELGFVDPRWILVGLAIGGLVGAVAAIRVEMTSMPEMVALFNGSGGLASALVAIASWVLLVEQRAAETVTVAQQITGVNGVALGLTILVGAVTFTGSVVAWGKLSGRLDGAPKLLPGRHFLNILLLLAAMGAAGALVFVPLDVQQGWIAMGVLAGTTSILGIGLVIPIGGGDMPVVISLLNSYSGLAAALAGFTINSPVLIVSGSMVGAAGLILTQIMCKAMNRSLANVLLGGFGGSEATQDEDARHYENIKRTGAEEAGMLLEDARSVIVVPGYGMAVAQAQHAVRELMDLLVARDCQVRFAIHPVAGRMPGHMNVLLAEADVPHELQVELERINNDFKNADVAIVIGANDVVNPVATEDESSPIAGMPVLKVWDARTVFVIKRSLSPGYAGIRNPLFDRDNTLMLFGDGKDMVEGLISALKEA